tara:strand:- start:2174 stop:5473 length:3300 start_codon:yes stop_codon:yes gene_type:complete
MKKATIITMFLFGIWSMKSQEKIPLIDSSEILTLANQSANDGKYEETLLQLNKIHKSDSAYFNTLSNRTYYLLKLKKYEEVIKIVNEGLSFDTEESKSTIQINKAVALIGLKQYQKAKSSIENALKIYPKHYLLWYNRGVLYESLGDIKESLLSFQKSITYNPFYESSHLKIGNLCHKQGLFAQALMSYNMYLLINPDGGSSFDILKSLNSNVATKYPEKKNTSLHFSEDDSNYESIDLVLNNHIALNANYKIDNEIDLSLTRQNHALLAQLKDLPKTNDFWSNKYIPLYQWIQNEGHFNNFTYTISYSIKNEAYKKIVDKKVKDIKAFLGLFREKWTSIVSQNTIHVKQQPVEVTYTYNNDDELKSYGPVKNGKEYGDWKFYDDNGHPLAEGSYNDKGERHGNWKWFHKNGKVKETATYVNGKADGRNLIYFKNGKLKADGNIVNNALEGEYKLYNDNGALHETKNFKNGNLEGPYLAYFKVGKQNLEYNIPYKNDSIHGKAIEYYSNGKVYQENYYQNGFLNLEMKYHFNGEIAAEVHYKNSELNGPYKAYHNNKQVSEEGQSLDGFFHGPWKTYYKNGKLESNFTYDKGAIHGIYKYYDTDGILFYEYEYRRGEIIAYKFYDKKGATLKEARKKGGEFLYEGLNPNGSIATKGMYDISGGKNGVWNFYSIYGVLTDSGNYVNNNPEGVQNAYFNDGSQKTISTYSDGKQNGYYAEYYRNGQISTQGWIKDDQQYGEWKDYYIDGTIKSSYYFHKGQYHGTLKSFSVDGKLRSEIYSQYNQQLKETGYDINGKVSYFSDYNSPEVNQILETKYSNGQNQATITFLNKVKHGPYTAFSFEGKKVTEGNYVNDKLHGRETKYHENGQIKMTTDYVIGNIHGEQISYFDSGKIEKKEPYTYGVSEGNDISYYKNGTVSFIRPYENGKIHGKYQFFDSLGKLQLIRYYNHGTPIGYSYHDKNGKEVDMIPIKNGAGKIKAYYDNGKVSREMEFLNGDLTNNYKSYYYSGQLQREAIFVEGQSHQKSIWYHPNGKVKKEQNYLYGHQHGLSKEYYTSGKIKLIENYLNDEKSGVAKYYNKKGKLTKELTYFDGAVSSLQEYK